MGIDRRDEIHVAVAKQSCHGARIGGIPPSNGGDACLLRAASGWSGDSKSRHNRLPIRAFRRTSPAFLRRKRHFASILLPVLSGQGSP
jgi:hypothetical protein